MDGRQFLTAAVRDAMVIDSLHRALYAMKLTNGAVILVDGVRGSLNFDHEIEKLHRSLYLLGVDTKEPLPIPFGGRK